MRILALVAIVSCAAMSLEGQQGDTTKIGVTAGSIQGTVRDARGEVLPGVTITVASRDLRKTAVTDTSGSYELSGLPAATYTVTAVLVGFATVARNDVPIRAGEQTHADFSLCLASLEEIDWIAPRDLRALWTKADVVARVEIAGTSSVMSECAQTGFADTATVREVVKDAGKRVNGRTLTFFQEFWAEERTPYPIGQELVVFLLATPRGLLRVAGPSSAFYVTGGKVVGGDSRYVGATGTMAIDEFLAELRKFGSA